MPGPVNISSSAT